VCHQVTAAGKAFTAEDAMISSTYAPPPNVASIIFDRTEVATITAMLEALGAEAR
jgi:hypothetical protein